MMKDIEISNIDNRTWIISNGSGNGKTHNYLIEGNEYAVLIDTGLCVIDLKSITQTLTTKEVIVINTHGHLDHIANNHQFDSIYMHPEDEKVLEEHYSYEYRYHFIAQRIMDKGCPNWLFHLPMIQEELNKQCHLPKQNKYKELYDGQTFDLGDRELKIIHTPGHTRGSICILDLQKNRLYVGDSICEKGVLLHFDHSTSLDIFQKSLNKLRDVYPLFDEIYPGHQMYPLSIYWIDDYIRCIDKINYGSAYYTEVVSNTGAGYLVSYGRATLSCPESAIKRI